MTLAPVARRFAGFPHAARIRGLACAGRHVRASCPAMSASARATSCSLRARARRCRLLLAPPRLRQGRAIGARQLLRTQRDRAACSTQGAAGVRRRTRPGWAAPTRRPTRRRSRARCIPGLTAASRPQAVVLVDEHDWPAALAASALRARRWARRCCTPTARRCRRVSSEALAAMHPTGAAARGRRTGDPRRNRRRSRPAGYRARRTLAGGEPAALAAASRAARWAGPRRRPASGDRGRRRRPARARDARRGPVRRERRADPVRQLHERSRGDAARACRACTDRRSTSSARRPSNSHVLAELAHFGPVKRDRRAAGARRRARSATRSPSRASPTARSAGASTNRATASCSPTPPGRSTRPRPRRCPPAATTARCCCSTSAHAGDPTRAGRLPRTTSSPAYAPQPPVRGVYNHGWLIGDEQRDLGGHPGRNRRAARDLPGAPPATSRRSTVPLRRRMSRPQVTTARPGGDR